MNILILYLFLITTARITNSYTIDYFDCTTPKSTKIYDLNNLCQIKGTNNATKLNYQLLVSIFIQLKNIKKREKRKKKENTHTHTHSHTHTHTCRETMLPSHKSQHF